MPKKRPPRYDAAFKRRAVEQVLLHHRPVAQVARQLECSPQSVNNWIEQHRSDISPARTTFLPLQVVDDARSTSSASPIEVVTKNGLTLRFPVDTSPDTLVEILHRLDAASC